MSVIEDNPAERRDADCLAFDPFEGDRDINVRTMRDGFVVVRKSHRCHICAGPIDRGSRARSLTQLCDGEIGTWRFCALCCDAMAQSRIDHGTAIDARYRIGEEARDRLDRLADGGTDGR
ncbi:hypothetical protein STVA_41770 [Allostella vacuolata]|nr:hypothetical protein STVA_41770 [Stella vacuolata]